MFETKPVRNLRSGLGIGIKTWPSLQAPSQDLVRASTHVKKNSEADPQELLK